MRVEIREEGVVTLVEPVGDIDGKTAPEFLDAAVALLRAEARVVLNLGQVAFMSSAGLRSMLLIYQQAKA